MKYMKKKIIIAFLTALVIQPSWNNTKAASKETSAFSLADTQRAKITYDKNGGYFVETLDDYETPSAKVSTYSTTSTKSKTKTVKYYNSNNTLCWSYTLKASFKVKSGISATYISSSASADIYKSTWSVAGENHSGSGNTATGNIKMKTSKTTITKTITIKCDKNGNFS